MNKIVKNGEWVLYTRCVKATTAINRFMKKYPECEEWRDTLDWLASEHIDHIDNMDGEYMDYSIWFEELDEGYFEITVLTYDNVQIEDDSDCLTEAEKMENVQDLENDLIEDCVNAIENNVYYGMIGYGILNVILGNIGEHLLERLYPTFSRYMIIVGNYEVKLWRYNEYYTLTYLSGNTAYELRCGTIRGIMFKLQELYIKTCAGMYKMYVKDSAGRFSYKYMIDVNLGLQL